MRPSTEATGFVAFAGMAVMVNRLVLTAFDISRVRVKLGLILQSLPHFRFNAAGSLYSSCFKIIVGAREVVF